MKKLKKDKALFVLLILTVLTFVVLLISVAIKKQLKESVVIPAMVCDRYFVPLDFQPEAAEKEVSLQYVKEGTELKGLQVNKKYPCYQNNGATLFLYAGNYNMIFSDFSESEGEPNVLISDMTVFSEETTEKIGEQVHLLRLVDNGICVNLQPIVLSGEITANVPQFSLCFPEKGRLSWYEYYRGRLRRLSIPVTSNTKINIGAMDYTYYEWLAAWNLDTMGVPSMSENLAETMYFYDMQKRYELNGNCVFRRTEGEELLLENQGVLYYVQGIALFEDEGSVLLPAGFGLVQPWARKANALPEQTRLQLSYGDVYLDMAGTKLGMNNAFIYSEAGYYIFLDTTEFVMGDIRITLEPLSMVIVEDALKLSVFPYQTKELKTYTVSGPIPEVELGHGVKLRPLQECFIRKDGKTELIVPDPKLLPLLQ